MPSPLPSSFASAAAGNSQESSGGPRRGDMSSGEWTRNRLNGATQTFRRPSVATNQSQTRESASASSTPTVGAYVPPHLNSNYQSGSARSGSGNDNRYSKEQLLEVFKNQRDSVDVADYLVGDWNNRDETTATNGHWGKRNDFNHAGPEVCWDSTGQMQPLAFQGMTDEEKNLFSSSVNSPLKPPPQAGSKDNAASGTVNRKTSVGQTQSHLNSFNTSSPGSARPNARRRGTGDSGGNTMSPTRNSRFFRDESNTTTPPPALLRRKTDFRDSSDAKVDERVKDRDSSIDLSTPYGTLKRSVTNPLSASSNGPASPWSTAAPSQSTGFSSMGGAFGNFNIGPITPGGSTDKKTSFGSLRGESRFKNLLSKRSSEDVGGVSKEKSTGLERLPETDNDVSRQLPARSIQTRASRSDTNPFEESRNGNAALGRQDIGTSASGIDQFGLSPFGIPTSTVASSGLMATTQQPASRHEPMSPTNTNPYQSPHRDKVVEPEDIDTDGSDIHPVHLPNLSELQDDPAPASFSSLQRNAPVEGPAGDRSQTSSVGAARGFPSLGGLGGLPSLSSPGGWPVSAAGGTPTRERSAFSSGFGDPIFGSMADLQSPSLSALGAGGFFGSGLGASTPTSNRPSKLGSLFPPAMQDQMRSDQTRQEMTGNESVAKSQGPSSPERGATMTTSAAAQGPLGTAPGQNTTSNQSVLDQSPQATQNVTQTSSTPGQLPTTQQRQMVMPDRMRWIYRDPQGNMQGPWSGLEMHDWFKAGFFTADLQVKKLEDAEYEPLAQLVRRIGNSREPFLVPQIGVPHGAPAQGPWGAPGPNGGVQPPFPSSFPSFGTTLTAEQQNALERRKQEEQYLMARQKEHLAQQQAMMKQMQIQQVAAATTPIHAHPLQHHPSAHSLHSQPSYGSITSPGGFQPPLMQAPIQPPQPQAVPGYLEPPPRQNTMPNLTPQMQPPSAVGGPEELPGLMDRLNVSRSAQFPFGAAENNHHAQQVATMLQDRARLQEEQEQFNRSKQADSIFDMQAREERLRQFHALRGTSDEDVNVRRTDGLPTHPVGLPSTSEQSQDQSQQTADKDQDDQILEKTHQPQQNVEQPLSLSQQVQKAASQRLQEQAQASTRQNESEWKADHGLPQPFPPPPSASPLPAPAAQRNRQNVADALAAGSRSQTHTPVETATTSVAPWAKDISDAPKGPSLKEIQEAEARQAAKLEEAAAAARRALAEQERANQPPPPAPGLPSTANWASATSTTPTPSVGSAWGKAGKGPVGSTPTAPKKTLAQIQKEEEARKQRQQAAAATVATNAQATMPSPAANAGKRYADLAGKVTPQTTISSGGAWTTVGAGGKPKPAPPAPVPQRSVTSTTPVSAAAKPRPVATTTRSATMAMPSTTTTNPNKATEELAKWAKTALGRGLNSSINVDDFVQQLLILPAETEIISDSVYANSQTLDGRRFAEEYVRRRKLADKGIVDSAVVNVGAFGGYDQKSSSDGWNEVAKKGQSHAHREEANSNAAFKVVAPKKKGKR